MVITEEMRKMAALKAIPKSELNNNDCRKYLKTCIKREKDKEPSFCDDRAEVNDDQTYYADEGT